MGRRRKNKPKKVVVLEEVEEDLEEEQNVSIREPAKKKGSSEKMKKDLEEDGEEISKIEEEIDEMSEVEEEDDEEEDIDDEEDDFEDEEKEDIDIEDEEEYTDDEEDEDLEEEEDDFEDEEKEDIDIEDEEEDEEFEVKGKRPSKGGSKKEEVFNAVDAKDAGPMKVDSDAVFTGYFLSSVFRDAVDQAWDDGVITADEMALLEVMKKKLKLDDATFDMIINDRKPEFVDEALREIEEEEKRLAEKNEGQEEPDDEELEDEDHLDDEDLEEDIFDEELEQLPEKEEVGGVVQGEVLDEPMEYIRKDEVLEKPPEKKMASPPKPPEMITFTHSVRSQSRPLDRSFDLTKRQEGASGKITKRCSHCRALIKVDPSRSDMACPVCGTKIAKGPGTDPGARELLDRAKECYKKNDMSHAMTLYKEVIEIDPANKEAQFYLQKLKARTQKIVPKGDVRNIAFVDTHSPRFDQLMGGGVETGDTVLIEGPPFCGKEILLEQLMASALEKGMPVIYISSNRAMKEVLRGIIQKVPDFKRYNKKGLIRMYDLFSKHKDAKVLKEGHRIFNIDDKEDFKRFQNDIVFVQEELVKMYHGGLLILNSLSPIISKVDHQDLMKFLQVLIARSKSYRFTNILDIASGVHDESTQNSIEYLMDGIIEFRELDMKNMLRLKGFTQNIMTRDWVEYAVRDEKLSIVGSFMEERIL